MSDISNLKQIRLEKLQKLKEAGINPYPIESHKGNVISHALENEGAKVSIAGRMFSFREHGNIAFADIKDESGKIQIFFQKKLLGDEKFKQLKLLDIGDFIQVEGTVTRTVAGEISVIPDSYSLLTKSLLPFPTEWFGVKDVEIRYRKRYLDLLLNEDSKKRFILRSKIIAAIREHMAKNNVIEVETPTLQPLYGGANARPFVTHHNALDSDFYLKISDELYLKRLVAGGMERVYEIDHDFRNEGVDKSHNPEFTMLETYWAYADYRAMMQLTEELYEYAAQVVHGTTTITYQGVEINLKAPWKRIAMKKAIKEYLHHDVDAMSDKAIISAIQEHEQSFLGKGVVRGVLIAKLFEFAEAFLIQPTFVTDFPKETTALCKPKSDDPDIIERFEPYINGWEIGNAYTELNDPILQRQYFEDQLRTHQDNKEEAQPVDEDFLEAMEYGMPPMGGLGLGIDRMIMLLTDAKNIKDVILFPTLRPTASVRKEATELEKTVIESGEKQFGKVSIVAASTSTEILTREKAYNLLTKHMESKNLIKHCLACEAAMKGIYKHLHKSDFNERTEEVWGITGLLHDVDYEVAQKENLLTKHGILLFERDPNIIPEPMAHAIKSHNYTMTQVQPESDLDWAITCVDQLTGLVVSSALIHPDKKLASIDAAFVLKRFNTPGFSKNVDRNTIKMCEEKLGIPLDQFITITLLAMQGIASEMGL